MRFLAAVLLASLGLSSAHVMADQLSRLAPADRHAQALGSDYCPRYLAHSREIAKLCHGPSYSGGARAFLNGLDPALYRQRQDQGRLRFAQCHNRSGSDCK